jgi:hypothetical protein
MEEEQTHGKSPREVRGTSFKRGLRGKRFYFLVGSDKSNKKIQMSELRKS